MIGPCHINEFSLVSERVAKLTITPNKPAFFLAGQYVYINFKSGPLPFSIANAPSKKNTLEFFIALTKEQPEPPFIKELRASKDITLSKPKGSVTVDKLMAKELNFIAIGTGIAPIKSMLEDLIGRQDLREKRLFWAVKSENDFYLRSEFNQLKKIDKNLTLYFISKEYSKEPLTKYIINLGQKKLKNSNIVLAGPFRRMFELKEFFLNQGCFETHLFSDAFNYGDKP